MECKEKMLEVLELTSKLSYDYGIFASAEFTAFGNIGEKITRNDVAVMMPSRKCLSTVGQRFANLDDSLDFAIKFLKDIIRVCEVKYE